MAKTSRLLEAQNDFRCVPEGPDLNCSAKQALPEFRVHPTQVEGLGVWGVSLSTGVLYTL